MPSKALETCSVIVDAQEKVDGNVNEGGHWAADLAIQAGADLFTWDYDGMGVALNEQVSRAFDGVEICHTTDQEYIKSKERMEQQVRGDRDWETILSLPSGAPPSPVSGHCTLSNFATNKFLFCSVEPVLKSS